MRIVLEAALGDVRDVHERLERDQVQLLQQPSLLGILDQRARRLAGVQVLAQLLQQVALTDRILVAGLRSLLCTQQPTLDGVEISERQLGVDHFDVVERLDAARDVHDVVVFEAAHDVRDRVRLANVRQELVAETFALGCTGDQAGDVDEFDGRGQDARRLDDAGQHIQTRVGHRHDADVRIDRAERIVLRRDLRARQRIEERRLADVRQTDDAALDTHERVPVDSGRRLSTTFPCKPFMARSAPCSRNTGSVASASPTASSSCSSSSFGARRKT